MCPATCCFFNTFHAARASRGSSILGWRRGAVWNCALTMRRGCCSRGIAVIPIRLQSARNLRKAMMLKVSAKVWTSLILWRSLKRLRRGCRAIRILALSDLPSIFFRTGLKRRKRNCRFVVRLMVFGGLGTKEGASWRSRVLGYWEFEESEDRGRFRALIVTGVIVGILVWGCDRWYRDV